MLILSILVRTYADFSPRLWGDERAVCMSGGCPKKKVPNMSIEARRNKKIKSDLAQGALLLEQLKGSGLRHTSELCVNLKS